MDFGLIGNRVLGFIAIKICSNWVLPYCEEDGEESWIGEWRMLGPFVPCEDSCGHKNLWFHLLLLGFKHCPLVPLPWRYL